MKRDDAPIRKGSNPPPSVSRTKPPPPPNPPAATSSAEAQTLRDKIRDGTVDCPIHPERCNANMGTHVPGCPWIVAVTKIYRIERAAEGITKT